MRLTFVKDKAKMPKSIGVLPCIEIDGKPGELIEQVKSCNVETIAKSLTKMTLTVYVREGELEEYPKRPNINHPL